MFTQNDPSTNSHAIKLWQITPACLLIVCFHAALCIADEHVDYQRHIKPLLATKCYSCHGALKAESELRLETKALMLSGGDSGPALVDGDPGESLIWIRVNESEDSRMPPAESGSPLTAAELDLLKRWIEQDAPAPDEEIPDAPSQHWAFQPIVSPELPSPDGGNPIDILLSAKRNQLGIKPQSEPARSLLIRRLYLDLVGLPPTIQQQNDARPWDKIVDELLASPHHGERWGRHWMDVWRYSDWYGLGQQLRYSQRHMWHWRDWIIDSLNSDKGYDRMVQEMLAGDELEPDQQSVVAGTGFLARNYYLFNRTTWLDSTIEHTGKAFLGLTLNCAKCHDHKYDPITHQDYYRFRAIFEPHQVRLDPVPGEIDLDSDGLPRVFDDQLDAETFLHVRGDPANPDRDIKITPGVPEILSRFQPAIAPVRLPATAFAPGTREYVAHDQLAHWSRRIDDAQRELAEATKRWESQVSESDAPPATDFDLTDDFENNDAQLWRLQGPGWQYKAGQLVQTVASRDRAAATLTSELPRDFELTCRYTTTGGSTYKSVTFRFDQNSGDQSSADQSLADQSLADQYANFVYTSAHEPGPKLQVAFIRDGNSSYPPGGRRARPIPIGESIELRFAVREKLVNVWIDDEFQLAYQLPDRGDRNRFSLSGFDATVAFDSIRVRALPSDFEMQPVPGGTNATARDSETQMRIATARLESVRLQRDAVQAVLLADAAKYLADDNEQQQTLARNAAQTQADALLAESEYERLAAGGDEKKLKAANGKREAAEKRLRSIQDGSTDYESLRVTRKALESPADKETDYAPIYPATTTGRRLALARWMTSTENPLTARVAVNHVWTRHFGQPLVESVFDFGLRCEEPLHAELLDHLAMSFMQSGWSFKHLHRLIVTSDAYRMSSSTADADPTTLQVDPDNRYYWRMPGRRMESQVVRDSLLHCSGTLNLTMGGPSVAINDATKRRSLYYKHSRDEQDKFLSMFDDADLLQCYRRAESIVPQQALAMANSALSMDAAEQIERRLASEFFDAELESFIQSSFQLLLARQASADEMQQCIAFCQQLRKQLVDESKVDDAKIDPVVRTRLIHVLLNHNDFVTIR
ncbi:PSD1 and planctomycete cytochrome C domain-containing protein [Stieleria varia]|uniref:Planctomycete cytochrome C n=1 Tax=Stieleria varia TaxID=2528005 RepID=A0A5C6A8H8_9BACT|nr:PSD1 and planctomycete cytochrome C domain-containing protein [Stieleria varia]TWT94593.1 Planctomycete cytochrome C [Stieleria varia]